MKEYRMYIIRLGRVEPIYQGSIMAKNRKHAILNFFPEAIMEAYYRGRCGSIGDYSLMAIKA